MTEEQYRDLKLDDVVFNEKTGIVRKISSQLSDPTKEIDEEKDYRWTNDFSGVYLSGIEGVRFKEKEDWHALKNYEDFRDVPVWVRDQILMIKVNHIENFLMEFTNFSPRI